MRIVFVRLFVFLVVIGIVSACSTASQQAAVSPEQQVQRIGSDAARTFSKRLAEQVTTALNEQGPVDAFEFCTIQAQPLTTALQQDIDENLTIKRTSLQWRNPVNAPDPHEMQALLYFENALSQSGELPEQYIQRVNAAEYRYYMPMRVADWCLNCHGDPARFDPALQRQLQEHYPGDLAVGYEEGDFRGVVRVSVPASQVR